MQYVKKEVYSVLNALATTYYEYAPSSAAFPCLVYKIASYSMENYPRIDASLEVYVMVHLQSTSDLDSLCTRIQNALNRKLINTSNVNIKIYYNDRVEDSDDSERTYRARILRFDMQVYEK